MKKLLTLAFMLCCLDCYASVTYHPSTGTYTVDRFGDKSIAQQAESKIQMPELNKK